MNALVTGGSRGIGSAIAVKLASEGINVVIHYNQAHEAAEHTLARCKAFGVRAAAISADIRSREQVERMKRELESADLQPDILVNNAGIAHYGLLTDVSEDDWDNVMDVNLKGMFLCTKAFVPPMVTRKHGRIINISSVWGLAGASCEVVYSTAKGGVNAFTKALAKELAPSGITVNAVAPGAVGTSMLQHLDEADMRVLIDEIPAGRLAQPEEIASIVYFLTLPESGYITGQIISPNGGLVT